MTFISYAQNFEDVILWRALKHVKDGFYIDVGANDPEVDSVTKAFYERGWRGINIEPLLLHYVDLKRDRARDINLNCAAGDAVGEINLFECDVRGWATADASTIERLTDSGHVGKLHRVLVTTLTNICSQNAPNEIHFLKVDVEGFEVEVLAGMDFERYRPWIVVVEATKPNSNEETHQQWEGMLLASRYQYAYADGLNRFYVANEHLELLSALKYPPNVLDNFALAPHVKTEAKMQEARVGLLEAEIGRLEAEEKVQQANIGRLEAEEKVQQIACWLKDLLSRRVLRVLTAMTGWPELSSIKSFLSAYSAKRSLRTIAVDLTPVLPGGENGGAKVFVLELLNKLAEMAPQTQFILLTQAASHEELAILDRSNMRRQLVVGSIVSNSIRPRLIGLSSRILPYLPRRLRNVVNSLGFKLSTLLKRGGSSALLRNMGADLLFCPFTAPTYFEPEIPTVCTIYDLQYKAYPEFFATEDSSHRERTFIQACRRATALTAISDFSRDSAIAHGNLAPSHIRTIYLRMAQRMAQSVEDDKAILVRLGLIPHRYLIYPANFWKHKNHEMLLTAFGMACQQGLAADIKLVCTGSPGARQEGLMSAAHAMNLGERILFPGYLPNAELAVLMANCTGMVFPSLYEGFGLPVIEAMAVGVPVACSNMTSLPEVAANAAILFDPRVPTDIAQAMISLVENDTLRVQLIRSGLRRAAEFSDADRMAREYWELFQYALVNENHENLLAGVYADGWIGTHLNVEIISGEGQILEMEFLAPDWLPQKCLTVEVSQNRKVIGNPLVFNRGTSAVLSLPIEPSGGCYKVRVSPTFVPARSGHGEDHRELSVILQKCRVVYANGTSVSLFPEEVLHEG
jgi:FkbM family methyltransferase